MERTVTCVIRKVIKYAFSQSSPSKPFQALNMALLKNHELLLSYITWVKSLKVSAKRRIWEAALAMIFSIMRGWRGDIVGVGTLPDYIPPSCIELKSLGR